MSVKWNVNSALAPNPKTHWGRQIQYSMQSSQMHTNIEEHARHISRLYFTCLHQVWHGSTPIPQHFHNLPAEQDPHRNFLRYRLQSRRLPAVSASTAERSVSAIKRLGNSLTSAHFHFGSRVHTITIHYNLTNYGSRDFTMIQSTSTVGCNRT